MASSIQVKASPSPGDRHQQRGGGAAVSERVASAVRTRLGQPARVARAAGSPVTSSTAAAPPARGRAPGEQAIPTACASAAPVIQRCRASHSAAPSDEPVRQPVSHEVMGCISAHRAVRRRAQRFCSPLGVRSNRTRPTIERCR